MNERPAYDGYTRPSVTGCLAGVGVALVIIVAAYVIASLLLPNLRAILAAPAIGLALLVVIGGLIAYRRQRKQREEKLDLEAAKAEKREQFEHWLDEERKEQS